MIELELPWPPSVNNYKQVGRMITTANGKLLQTRKNSPETNRYYYEAWVVIRSYKFSHDVKLPISATISLEVDVFPPDSRKRDLDNILKVLLDSLVRGGLIVDDSQVARLLVERKAIIPQGKVIIRVTEL